MTGRHIDFEFLEKIRTLHEGMMEIGVPPSSSSVTNVCIRAMQTLFYDTDFGPLDELVADTVLIADGVWGEKAKAAFAMITYIVEHGEYPPNDEDTQVEDQQAHESGGCGAGS